MGAQFDRSYFLAALAVWAGVAAGLAVAFAWAVRRSSAEEWLRGSVWSVGLAAGVAATLTVTGAFVAGAPGAMLEDDLTVLAGGSHPLVEVSWYLFVAGLHPASGLAEAKPVGLPVLEGWLVWLGVGGTAASAQRLWWRS